MTTVNLMQMLSIGLLFVLLVTKAYTKSISTAVYVVSLTLSLQFYVLGELNIALCVIILGAALTLIRAVFNHDVDQLIKR